MPIISRKSKEYDPNDVSCPTSDYEHHMTLIELPNDLMGGTLAMRAKTKKYLPKSDAEEPDKYKERLNRTFLLNSFEKTVERLSGEVFSEPVTLSEDVSDEIRTWSGNIDLSGHNITRFAKDVFEGGLINGAASILVDMPSIPTRVNEDTGINEYEYVDEETGEVVWKPLTREALRSNEWRPYFVYIDSTQLIGTRVVNNNGVIELTQVRIFEVTDEPDGLYGTKEVERIRVLEPGRYQVFINRKEKDKDEDNWILEKEGTTLLDYIPLVTYLVGQPLSQTTAEPPLDDLAWLNLAHYQSSSDQKNILHYARMIIFFSKFLKGDESPGKKTEDIVMGANILLNANHEQADLKVVEHSGKAIEAGRNDLKDLEEQMRRYGLSLMVEKRPGGITATEASISSAESDTTLMSWALGLEDALNEAYNISIQMIGEEPPEKSVAKVNRDYKSFLKSLDVRELRRAWVDGLLPREVVLEEYKRRGVINSELDFVEVMKMLGNEERNMDFSSENN